MADTDGMQARYINLRQAGNECDLSPSCPCVHVLRVGTAMMWMELTLPIFCLSPQPSNFSASMVLSNTAGETALSCNPSKRELSWMSKDILGTSRASRI